MVKRNLWKFAAIALVLGSYHLAAAEPDSRTDMGQVKSLDVFPSKVALVFVRIDSVSWCKPNSPMAVRAT